jgi:DNA-binding Lrp family transcriptional regulator
MSLIWEINFPTATQKLLMLRVSDYADDDGSGVYPAIPEVSRQIGTSERQVQYAIKALEEVGLLSRITVGGGKRRSTNVWTINVDVIAKLALQEVVLNGTHDSLELVENRGAIIAPRTLQRVQSRLQRVKPTSPVGVQSATSTGEAHFTLTLKEPSMGTAHLREPACEGTSVDTGEPEKGSGQSVENSFERSGGQTDILAPAAPAKWQLVTSGDSGWSQWMSWATESGLHNLRRAAESEGRLVVQYSRPRPGMAKPMLAPRYGSPKLEALLAACDARDGA